MEHPESGERLQYLGSTQDAARGWLHVFRHRQVPGSHQRDDWHIPASAGWEPEHHRRGPQHEEKDDADITDV